MKNRIIIVCALALVMDSCVKTKFYQVNDANRDWFADTTNLHFTMMDDNGIMQSFRFDAASSYSTETGATILFIIPTDKGVHEHIDQSGSNTYGSIRVSTALSAYKNDDEHEGTDEFRMYFNEAIYAMRIDGNQFYPDKCYETDYNGGMEYTVEYLDSFGVSGKNYEGVMHLKLIDIAYPRTMNFPTEIYYAKQFGLIQCTLDNKVSLYRMP
ncbi:MAG: hypothetical protein IIU48_02260 [Prevotella sp.]|nr:hypothetical protein [Prevotella sp.]